MWDLIPVTIQPRPPGGTAAKAERKPYPGCAAGRVGAAAERRPFLHVRRLPEVVARLLTDQDDLHQAKVVAASSRPRAAEDSYMPCFLAGVCEAKTLASALGAEYMEFSHQQGHLAAAAWSAGREDLLDQPFLAWHLSGGTTELYWCSPKTGCLMRKNRRHHGYFCRAAAGSYWRFAGPAVSCGKICGRALLSGR